MGVCEEIRAVFPEAEVSGLAEYYNMLNRCERIYSGEPEWRYVKKNGLYRGGSRSLAMLNAAKILCDRFAVLAFAEVPEIIFSNEKAGKFVKRTLEENDLYGKMHDILSRAFAMGSCVFRPYISGGRIGIDCVFGNGFVPTEWDFTGIKGGCFKSVKFMGGKYFTLFELHENKNGTPAVTNRVFCSKDGMTIGREVPADKVYKGLKDSIRYDGVSEMPLFSCFRTAYSNNIFPDIPLGLPAFANAADTLKALDVAFDSFSREFVLGKKRIIVPSSCVQTVVDITTGEPRQYFDADDEAYVALKCDEDRDLKITDNTVVLRVDEHIKAINALLNILCSQVGLSSGTLSFDAESGVKTATEIISRDSRTAATIKANQNNLEYALKRLFRIIAELGVYLGELSHEEADSCRCTIRWHDGIVTDENVLIDNMIRLVNSGLISKLTAISEIRKCGYEDAEHELEQISREREMLVF